MLGRSRRAAILVADLVAFGLACAAYSLNRHSHDAAALEEAGRPPHRLISQGVDQHDAHLTSLSALVQAAEPARVATVEQVAASIIRFYPRIVGIDVVDLALNPPRSLLMRPTPLLSRRRRSRRSDRTCARLHSMVATGCFWSSGRSQTASAITRLPSSSI